MLHIIFTYMVLSGSHFYHLEVQPIDLQNPKDEATFFREIYHVAFDDETMWLHTPDPEVIKFDFNSNFHGKIGGRGQGPGELGSSQPCAVVAKDNRAWIIRSGCRQALYFESGKFVTSFRFNSYQVTPTSLAADHFAFDRDHVVIQAYPRSGVLANVYDYGGNIVATMGKILPIEREFLEVNNALNHTMWAKWGDRWVCLFAYRPILRIFGPDFQLEQEWILSGPEIELAEAIYMTAEPVPNLYRPIPHFRDMKVVGDHVYALSRGVLYQIDPANGQVLSRSMFKGGDETHYGNNIWFSDFAISPTGRIFLTVAPSYRDRDMWTVQLPFWPQNNAQDHLQGNLD